MEVCFWRPIIAAIKQHVAKRGVHHGVVGKKRHFLGIKKSATATVLKWTCISISTIPLGYGIGSYYNTPDNSIRSDIQYPTINADSFYNPLIPNSGLNGFQGGYSSLNTVPATLVAEQPVTSVPEPSSAVIMAMALIVMILLSWRRRS